MRPMSSRGVQAVYTSSPEPCLYSASHSEGATLEVVIERMRLEKSVEKPDSREGNRRAGL